MNLKRSRLKARKPVDRLEMLVGIVYKKRKTGDI